MKTWKEFLVEKSDGKKPYSELTKDYYLYMQQELHQPDRLYHQ